MDELLTMTNEETIARTEGRTAGQDINHSAGDCPYPHSRADLRLAWMDGFGEGRDSIASQVAEQATRSQDEEA